MLNQQRASLLAQLSADQDAEYLERMVASTKLPDTPVLVARGFYFARWEMTLGIPRLRFERTEPPCDAL